MNQSELEANTCSRRQAREKRVEVGHDCFWLYFWLIYKAAQDFVAIPKA